MARDLVNSVDVASTIDAAVLSSDTNGSGIVTPPVQPPPCRPSATGAVSGMCG